ncbi:MAG: hypothetical protein IK955_00405 [Clostridia bacterium]|nr:hypothetical protein [Clostridia bacterium]
MKKSFLKIISLFLSLTLVFSISSTGVMAAENESVQLPSSEALADKVTEGAISSIRTVGSLFEGLEPVDSGDAFLNNILKVLYNALNVIVEVLVKTICTIYPDPAGWKDLADHSTDTFLEGRDEYKTSANAGNCWSLGYSSRSLIPDDFESGKYYLGRDLMNKKAEGIYDDMRIRVAVLDDNSGDGAVVLGAIDALGVTSTDVRSIRAGVLEYCKQEGIAVSSINIMSTHAHSALDTQGVSTEFFYKLFVSSIQNLLGIQGELPFMEAPAYFKQYFVEQSIIAVTEAFEDMESGSLYYDSIDASEYIKDKRDLVSKEDIPEIAALYFVPDSGSEDTYIADITCHPTSFSASNGLVASDYIYYIDEYIKAQEGANFVMIQGACGQLTRDNIDVDTTGMDEWEEKGADTKFLGETFGEFIISAEYETELDPIINVHHKEIVITPENSILALACEINLVNNQVYYLEDGVGIISEMGYLEFGNKVGFALFPGEFYPEVFWGHEIIGDTTWDGSDWQYASLADSVEGVDVYCVSLANDALGYVLTDDNFAFMGHIIGEGIADEVLSVGKHTGSYFVSNYLELLDSYIK